MSDASPPTSIYTIGHSTHPFDEFVALLRPWGITRVADVRTAAASRRNPQFTESALASSLPADGIAYQRLPALGGWRRASPDSPNMGWRNVSFRGYADYMQTPEFAAALDDLIALARDDTVAIMCAEAVPWRCHRSLIADALVVRGIAVRDITSPTRATPHHLTPFAHVEGLRITYPAVASP
jgi:uncharacterized protein (DUF488 family)